MPSTTVHIPSDLLEKIDKIASRKGISRNRFVIEACNQAVEVDGGRWPDGFFDQDFDKSDWNLLRQATMEMESPITANRRNRGAPIL